ncbi:hypothetical protein [Baekduia sp.]|jgi:hypothetical protein|uniref:hypothetical protein n=1 Tax=Baekduia sp. TaxID=2600305 RepID=UPI002DFA51AE|nr:hypothetical protein [Baekduia sp.]
MVISSRVALSATLVPVALGLGAAGAANADVGGRPIGLVPDKTTAPKARPGVTPNATVSPGTSYRCDDSGTLRRGAGSYVTGWCTAPNMHIDISSGSVNGYQSGWGEGNFQHCGWFQSSIHGLTPNGTYDHNCGGNYYNENTFATQVNVSPSNDGSPAPVLKNCAEYANVQPWNTGNMTGYDQVGTLSSSTVFLWRYKSLNNFWVLGRISPAAGVYDWVFVQAACVGAPASGTRAAAAS